MTGGQTSTTPPPDRGVSAVGLEHTVHACLPGPWVIIERVAHKFYRTNIFASMIHFFLPGGVLLWKGEQKDTKYIQHDLDGVESREFSDKVYVFFPKC